VLAVSSKEEATLANLSSHIKETDFVDARATKVSLTLLRLALDRDALVARVDAGEEELGHFIATFRCL